MKSIVVAFDGTQGAISALDHAMLLADRSGGHVTAVLAHASAEIYAAQGNWIPAEARQVIARTNARITEQVEAAFATEAERFGAEAHLSFEKIAGRVDDVLARRARAADLLVTAQPGENVDMHVLQHPDQIALRSGRPLLIVPAGCQATDIAETTAVAWDGKRAAARALADALPLIRPGSSVTLLTVGANTLTRPTEEVLAHLGRHGLTARHVVLPDSRRVTDQLIDYCAEAKPALLVMGAYEHSKFQVDLIGGPTTEILSRAAQPVLMSH